ncbi:hypothetical protein [Candidatus Sodalis pierantonius]|uniref:hypothetical protein n=1 Tax=Candidatus Sodalis pierantonii TaxID=1486991 RepID=UPI003AA82CAC
MVAQINLQRAMIFTQGTGQYAQIIQTAEQTVDQHHRQTLFRLARRLQPIVQFHSAPFAADKSYSLA